MDKKYIYSVSLDADTAPAKILNLVGRNKNVLEVGCASGVQSKILVEELGCTVTGIEINPDAAEDARKYCETVIVGNIEQLSPDKHFFGRKYDVILFADVLEHLYDPGSALEKIKYLLSDEGYVLASIPNIVHMSVILEMMNGNFDYRQYGLLDNTHIRFFTRKSIYQLFEKAGLVITHLDRVICADCDTEFSKIKLGEASRDIINYIRRHNLEADTFQFVLKAHNARDGSKAIFSELLIAEQRIKNMEQDLNDKDLVINRLESSLQWLHNKPMIKFINKLRNIFNRHEH